MNKGLEAFERIKNITYDRTDLYGIEEYRKSLDTIEKSLKALEIIKEKRVNIHLLILSDSLEKYNFNLLPYRKLTQEEYDLLKEILWEETK